MFFAFVSKYEIITLVYIQLQENCILTYEFQDGGFMTTKKSGSVKELEYAPMKGVVVDGKEILIAKTGTKIFAIGNTCTHRGCKLSGGKLEGETVRCPCHGSVFNVRTGEVMKGPAKSPEPSYTVTVENDVFSIDL
jgi:nitrite reductase/ring-hydroxylating ferredoxin subunit